MMVSSGISASGSATIAKDSSFSGTAKSESNGLDFNRLMTKSLSVNSSGNTDQINRSTKKEISSASDISNKSDKVSDSKIDTKNNSKTDTRNDSKTDRTADSDSATGTDKVSKSDVKADGTADTKNNVQDSKNVSETTDTDSKKIDQILADIKNEIKNTFGISDEDLEAAMANLGITLQDLMQPKNLTDLVCEITGTENAMSLLTDSGLSENLKSLMNFTDNKITSLAKEMNITPEELKSLIEKSVNSVKEQPVQPVQESIKQIPAEDSTIASSAQQENGQVQIRGTEENKKTSEIIQTESNDLNDVITGKVEIAAENESGGSTPKNSSESGKNTSQSATEITNNLTANIQNAFDNIIAEEASTGIDTADVIKQIVEAAKVTVSEGISSMEIQLNPQNLGKINLTVVAKDGMITAQITAENETVKKAIENQLNVLRENFANQGIKVDAVEVTIASHAFESNQNLNKGDSQQESGNKKSGRALSLDSLDDLQEDELSDEEKRVMQLMKDNHSSVEYSA